MFSEDTCTVAVSPIHDYKQSKCQQIQASFGGNVQLTAFHPLSLSLSL